MSEQFVAEVRGKDGSVIKRWFSTEEELAAWVNQAYTNSRCLLRRHTFYVTNMTGIEDTNTPVRGLYQYRDSPAREITEVSEEC